LEEEGIQSSESSLEDTDQSSQSFDEGYQLGLLKGIEKAHAEALEEFAFERGELQTQVSTLKAQVESAQAQEITLVAKIDELTQSIEQQRAQLDTEREALRAENAAALESQKKLLEEVTSKLDDFVSHPQPLFEPLKRLSVHIAEQLVLAELNLSGASIERLIQRCLDEISSHSNQVVTVELNTQDKARLQEMTGEMFSHIQLHAVSSLQPGSVRVITDDTQVDDLIGHRLEAMANNLLAQPELWREASPFFKQPLAQRDTDIEDVRQRLTTKVERQEEDQDD
jgi:flagellar biosynthesis/type III secretory pathway protein FliH